ncbi:hypothetical protein F3W80_05160 [Vibrio parahaemolyticus]|nr:hypothetical protein [Vibrio parahaemolyticus]
MNAKDDLRYKLAGYEREGLLFYCWIATIIWFSLRLLFDGTEYSLPLEYSVLDHKVASKAM